MSGIDQWESTYKYAKKLLQNAMSFGDMYAKAKNLKEAWNATCLLPSYYYGKDELLADIKRYANSCGIDLDKVSGY